MTDSNGAATPRRDLLRTGAAAIAGAAAAAAATAAAPLTVLAANGDTFHVGDSLSGSSTTSLAVSGTTAFFVMTDSTLPTAAALKAESTNLSGGIAVLGTSPGGYGVQGVTEFGTGVYGTSTTGTAVRATSTEGAGVYATASTTGTGAYGWSNKGIGVYGSSTDGTGVRAESAGTALKVVGKADFNRSGKATIAKGSTSVKVTVPGGLTTSSLGFANLRKHQSGVYITAVIADPATGKLTIRLSKAAPSSTTVSWLVVR